MGFIDDTIGIVFAKFQENVPANYQPYFVVGFFTIIMALYAAFIWKFHRFLARRDLIHLNLRKYSRHKGSSVFFYFLEYIIILPVLVFIGFGIFSMFILVLSKNQSVYQILLISAGVFASVRLLSYFNEELSKDIAKIFPFTILVVFLLDPTAFSLDNFLNSIKEIPSLFDHILIYLIFIVVLEVVLRFLFLIGYFLLGIRLKVKTQSKLFTPTPFSSQPAEEDEMSDEDVLDHHPIGVGGV